MERALVRTLALGAAMTMVVGCQSASCESNCEVRANQCGVDAAACSNSCLAIEAIADRFECAIEHDDVLACEAENNSVCGEGLALACAPEIEARGSCIRTACGEAPMDAACISSCTELCEGVSSVCGISSALCEEDCQLAASVVVRTGCGPQYWDQLGCISRTPSSACSAGGLEVGCPGEAAALASCSATFCAANPSDPLCIVPQYRACGTSTSCASPTSCMPVVTDSSSGSMCTTGCADDFDCPSVGSFAGVCLSATLDSTFQCFMQCDSDANCGAGSICLEVVRTDGLTDFVCFPDNA